MKKENRGGARLNAGRPPKENAKVNITYRVDPTLAEWLKKQEKPTELLETALTLYSKTEVRCNVTAITQKDFEEIVFIATGERIDAKEKDAKMSETEEYGKVIYVDVTPFIRVYVCADFRVFLVLSMRHPCKNYKKILPILLKYAI